MKKAFTLLELVFVVVAIGILAAAIIPRINTNRLPEAAHQLVSHVRYVQHLAMSDDKYDSLDSNWYKNKWQIMFERSSETGGGYSYTIFSDFTGTSTGNADAAEIAVNPLDRNKRLTGGTTGIEFNKPEATTSMNLGRAYGVDDLNDLKFTGGTSSNAKRVLFDHMGRPYRISSSMSSPIDGIATSPIFIKLCTDTCSGADNLPTNDNEVVVRINNETGYSCVLDTAGNCLDI
ncbi:prepilin-type N-terminal cleavage/methylation domain-containing protein [Sulfurimonas sp.]|uniref:prepilin-type N-terminal cleavage/methylation domain-containing protein n=1 Tax=Sulfurimonas sp. TaxID=2022749 RepID=UPI003564F618